MTRGDRAIAFIHRYCLIPSGKSVGKPLRLLPFQERFVKSVYDNPAGTSRAYLSIARKNGKALALDTPIPTPDGWTTMGDIREGDVLFDERGKQCRVTFATQVQEDRDCFRVRFADGAEIVADADHQWTVESRSRHGRRVTLTTAQMARDVVLPYARGDRVERNYSVDVARPIDCPDAELLLPPYMLGAWLGDGDSAGASLTGNEDDGTFIAAQIAADGVAIRRVKDCRTAKRWAISDGVKNRAKDCAQVRLRTIGVLGNKHIPMSYQRASIAQRMALLQGLMDTDGSITKSGQCEFVGVNKRLVYDVLHLVRGLGHKATITEDRAKLNGRDCGPRYRVQFWGFADSPVFRLPRKMARLKQRPARSRNDRNYIVAIDPVASVPVRCIQVDSPSRLFLAGEAFTPTHNTALIAALALVHLVGPEAKLNSQIISGARSRDQAALVYDLAEKMVSLSPQLSKLVRAIPSKKMLIGLPMNVEFKAISADAGTAHGLSPVLAILDEVGQVKGLKDAFIEAIETAQGAHDAPLLLAISTQAATDGDLFSDWLDKARDTPSPRIVSHVYAAPDDCELTDREAWAAANPALGVFRSVQDMEDYCARAVVSPTQEASFRWLFLNQRVEADAPYVSRAIWAACAAEPDEDWAGAEVYAGLDLSSVSDLTAFVRVACIDDVLHVKATFWLPGVGLAEKARADRVPYDIWADQGHLLTTPSRTVDYDWVAPVVLQAMRDENISAIAFDRWNMKHFRQALDRAGASESEVDRFVEFGQGFQSMSPALRALDSVMLTGRMRHGGHPVLTMCAANAVIKMDPAGNRKLVKAAQSRRIDGMVALAMAAAIWADGQQEGELLTGADVLDFGD